MHRPLLRSAALVLVAGLGLTLATACDVYDESLLGTGGSGQGGGSTTTSSQSGGGGEPPVGCETPSECPGDDNECGTRTCVNQICGIDAVAQGTPVGQQTAGDCVQVVCDGNGQIDTVADPSDAPNDNNDCTTDSCSEGAPLHTPRAVGSLCTGAAGAKVCNAEAACVACVVNGDCTSNVCTQAFTCAPASCGDNVKNGTETDIDCGGSACPKCALGKICTVGSDCLSTVCNGTCQPSCSDGVKNQGETDIDCGGPNCGPCALGDDCTSGGDCITGRCISQTCAEYQLVVSELRGRGPGGATDDFIEIYNPLGVAVTVTSDIEVAHRGDNASYTPRWTGTGTVIGARRHFLIAGNGYTGAAAADVSSPSGGVVSDKASVIIRRKSTSTIIDAACITCGTSIFTPTHVCEGTPFELTGCTSNNADRAVERKPGGTNGNGLDSNDNTNDFQLITPSNPQNLMSPATP
jgi:hypothetical protein